MRFNLAPLVSLLPIFASLSSALPRPDSINRRALSYNEVRSLFPRAESADLENAAFSFIKLMQTVKDGQFKDREVLIIGGQAIQHYYPDYRQTDDSDINIKEGRPPVKSIKEIVAQNSDGKISAGLGGYFIKLDNGNEISIDAVDSALARDKPTGYKKASEINSASDLPYIPKNDLLAAKLVSCSERTDDDKAAKDAADAKHIVDTDGDVGLTDDQKKIVVEGGCMNSVFEKTDTDAKWWAEKAGLTGLVGDDAEDEQEDAADDAEDNAEDAEEEAEDAEEEDD
ncbi:MAG: hypothetical protein Q9198_004715 [Flavoplaca austrocitrina]